MSSTKIISAHSANGPGAVIRDLREGFEKRDVWTAFAWDEMQNRYRRSAIGLAWIAIGFIVFTGGISIFFGSFSARGGVDFLYYVGIGFATFSFLMGNVVDGCGAFKSAASWIKSTDLPYSVYVYKSVARSLIPFVIQIGVMLAVMLGTGWSPTWWSLAAIPAFAVFILNSIWAQIFFGLFAARWSDVQYFVGATQRILFFSTPIMWVYDERTGFVKVLASVNPLTHFLEIFRAPLYGEAPPLESWAVVSAMTVLGWVAALAAGSVMRRRIPFWV